MNIRTQIGFTIIELMLTITVAGIILAAGVPALSNFVKQNAAVTEVNRLVGTFTLARSEASQRGVSVVVVPSQVGNWSGGWLVGIDSDGDTIFPEAGEPVFRRYKALNATAISSASTRVEFQPTGEVDIVATFTMVPKDCASTHDHQRVINIALAGYVDLSKGACP